MFTDHSILERTCCAAMTAILASAGSVAAQEFSYLPGLVAYVDRLAVANTSVTLAGVPLTPGSGLDADNVPVLILNTTDISATGATQLPYLARTAGRFCGGGSVTGAIVSLPADDWKIEADPGTIAVVFDQRLQLNSYFTTQAVGGGATAVDASSACDTHSAVTVPFEVAAPTDVDLWLNFSSYDLKYMTQQAIGTWSLRAEIYYDWNGNGEIDLFDPLWFSTGIGFHGNTGGSSQLVSVAPTLDNGTYVLRVDYAGSGNTNAVGVACQSPGATIEHSDLLLLAEAYLQVR